MQYLCQQSFPVLSFTAVCIVGVTRRSVIALLEDMGYTVQEDHVTISEALECDEVFTTGTAVVVSSVGSLTYEGATYSMPLYLVINGVA